MTTKISLEFPDRVICVYIPVPSLVHPEKYPRSYDTCIIFLAQDAVVDEHISSSEVGAHLPLFFFCSVSLPYGYRLQSIATGK